MDQTKLSSLCSVHGFQVLTSSFSRGLPVSDLMVELLLTMLFWRTKCRVGVKEKKNKDKRKTKKKKDSMKKATQNKKEIIENDEGSETKKKELKGKEGGKRYESGDTSFHNPTSHINTNASMNTIRTLTATSSSMSISIFNKEVEKEREKEEEKRPDNRTNAEIKQIKATGVDIGDISNAPSSLNNRSSDSHSASKHSDKTDIEKFDDQAVSKRNIDSSEEGRNGDNKGRDEEVVETKEKEKEKEEERKDDKNNHNNIDKNHEDDDDHSKTLGQEEEIKVEDSSVGKISSRKRGSIMSLFGWKRDSSVGCGGVVTNLGNGESPDSGGTSGTSSPGLVPQSLTCGTFPASPPIFPLLSSVSVGLSSSLTTSTSISTSITHAVTVTGTSTMSNNIDITSSLPLSLPLLPHSPSIISPISKDKNDKRLLLGVDEGSDVYGKKTTEPTEFVVMRKEKFGEERDDDDDGREGEDGDDGDDDDDDDDEEDEEEVEEREGEKGKGKTSRSPPSSISYSHSIGLYNDSNIDRGREKETEKQKEVEKEIEIERIVVPQVLPALFACLPSVLSLDVVQSAVRSIEKSVALGKNEEKNNFEKIAEMTLEKSHGRLFSKIPEKKILRSDNSELNAKVICSEKDWLKCISDCIVTSREKSLDKLAKYSVLSSYSSSATIRLEFDRYRGGVEGDRGRDRDRGRGRGSDNNRNKVFDSNDINTDTDIDIDADSYSESESTYDSVSYDEVEVETERELMGEGQIGQDVIGLSFYMSPNCDSGRGEGRGEQGRRNAREKRREKRRKDRKREAFFRHQSEQAEIQLAKFAEPFLSLAHTLILRDMRCPLSVSSVWRAILSLPPTRPCASEVQSLLLSDCLEVCVGC